jgi:hypothetical protein
MLMKSVDELKQKYINYCTNNVCWILYVVAQRQMCRKKEKGAVFCWRKIYPWRLDPSMCAAGQVRVRRRVVQGGALL